MKLRVGCLALEFSGIEFEPGFQRPSDHPCVFRLCAIFSCFKNFVTIGHSSAFVLEVCPSASAQMRSFTVVETSMIVEFLEFVSLLKEAAFKCILQYMRAK